MTNILSNFFGTTAFWVVNKHLAKSVGIEASLLLNDLYSKQCFFEERGELVEGYFFNTRDNIEADTTLSPHKQRQALQILEKFGFVKTKVMGLPKKTYYLVIHDKLLNFLTTGDEKISRQEVKKFNTNNNKLIRIKNNNKLIKEKINYFEKFKDDKELIEWCNLYSEAINKRCIKSIELHEELKKMTDWVDSKKKAHSNPLRFAKNWLQKKLDNLPVSISLSTSQPTYSPNLQEIDPDYEPPQTYRRGGMQSISNLLNF